MFIVMESLVSALLFIGLLFIFTVVCLTSFYVIHFDVCAVLPSVTLDATLQLVFQNIMQCFVPSNTLEEALQNNIQYQRGRRKINEKINHFIDFKRAFVPEGYR